MTSLLWLYVDLLIHIIRAGIFLRHEGAPISDLIKLQRASNAIWLFFLFQEAIVPVFVAFVVYDLWNAEREKENEHIKDRTVRSGEKCRVQCRRNKLRVLLFVGCLSVAAWSGSAYCFETVSSFRVRIGFQLPGALPVDSRCVRVV